MTRVGTWVDTVVVRPRVLIVDDHDGFRSVARTLLDGDLLDVVGEAADGDTAVRAALEFGPDIVLLDVHLPGADGFAVAELLTAIPRPPTVVLISSRPIADLRTRVSRSSAVGFLPKDELSGSSVLAAVGG
jgi:DNA-binding NarL/FixJ family response regulator